MIDDILRTISHQGTMSASYGSLTPILPKNGPPPSLAINISQRGSYHILVLTTYGSYSPTFPNMETQLVVMQPDPMTSQIPTLVPYGTMAHNPYGFIPLQNPYIPFLGPPNSHPMTEGGLKILKPSPAQQVQQFKQFNVVNSPNLSNQGKNQQRNQIPRKGGNPLPS